MTYALLTIVAILSAVSTYCGCKGYLRAGKWTAWLALGVLALAAITLP